MTTESDDGRGLARKPGGSLNKIEEKYEEVAQLIAMAKEKGYLDHEDVLEVLPEELTGSEEIDEVFTLLDGMGIEVMDHDRIPIQKPNREAAKHRVALYPFFLAGVTGNKGMVQGDSLHPTFGGIKIIVTGIVPAVKRALGAP